MDMLPPQAPPAIVVSVDQPEHDLLRRLGDAQAWLHAQQDELPDPYVSADDRERFLQGVDAFWEGVVPDTSLPVRASTTRRQAFTARLTQAARDSASLHVGRHLLPSSAIDMIRRVAEPASSMSPPLRGSELLIGDAPLAGTLVLQDDTQPDTVLLFGTRTGWERFASIDELLCEVEERLQVHLFQADDDHALDEVDTHFLRIRPIQGPVYEAIADRLVVAYRESLIRTWDDETFAPDWEDRLHDAMQLSNLLDLHRLGALPAKRQDAVLSRARRSPPVKPAMGTGTPGRAVGGARRVGEHLGPVVGATHRIADDIARQWGVGVPAGPTRSPGASTLPRPQEMFSRRYSAPEVTLPADAQPSGGVHYVEGLPYVQRGALPYRVQYDPTNNAWRLSSVGPTQGMNTGPIIDLGPNGQWEIRFPASHEGVTQPVAPQDVPPLVHRDTGAASHPDSQAGSPPVQTAPPLTPRLPPSPLPIDLPPVTLSELPKLLKDIIREELARQLDNDVVGALALFRRLRRWHDGGPLVPVLTPREIDAWNRAMAGMRDRLRHVRSPSPHDSSVADQLTDGDLDVVTPEDLLPAQPSAPHTTEGALIDLLATPTGPTSPRELTPETLDAWSDTVNQFVARPRLTTSPAAGPSTQSPPTPPSTIEVATGPIHHTPLPEYRFDRPGLNERAQIIEEMARLMPSASDAEALFKRLEAAFLAGEPVPRLTRIQENAWRGALTHMRLPRGSAYRARRMEAAEVPNAILESIRNRLNYLKKPEAYDPLVYLRDRNKDIVELTDEQKALWQQLLEHTRKRTVDTADVGIFGKRSPALPHGKVRKELNDLSSGNLRAMERRLAGELNKEAQLEIFRHKVNDQLHRRPLLETEERAWERALAAERSKPSRFGKHVPADAIRDFSTADMQELWLELKAKMGFRLGERTYKSHALRESSDVAPMTEAPPQWQRAVDAVRHNRRASPTATTTPDQIARGLWYVPAEQWPTTLYYYAPTTVLAEATDHVVRLPIGPMDSLGAEGIPVFTSPPDTAIIALPNRHTALLPAQEVTSGLDALAPPGSIGARSGAWVRFNPSEARESLDGFVELYRVGDATSTSFVFRSTAQNTENELGELWLGTPFVIHRRQP